jgi:hypothetical protein
MRDVIRLSNLVFILLLTVSAISIAGTGDLSRNLVVLEDGDAALVTSMGGSDVRVVDVNAAGGPGLGSVDVGAPSWGITWLESCPDCPQDSKGAVVTHPGATRLSYITGDLQSGFTATPLYNVPIYCTEIIAAPEAGRVLIANRGEFPSGPDSWRHAVYLYDVESQSIVRTFYAEREPRSLAWTTVSGQTLLFVGHAQGDLKLRNDSELGVNNPVSAKARDGGSIVEFDYATGSQLDRFAVGTPVRGLAVLPPPEAPSEAAPPDLDGGFQLFFTHAGDGAQSEDPGFGGRAIANVLSSIEFDSTGVALDRVDAAFDHSGHSDDTGGTDFVGADLDPAGASGLSMPDDVADFPTVLPEKIVVRWISGTPDYGWELWVIHSASGTVSRVDLLATDGSFDVNGSFQLSGIPVVKQRTASGPIANSAVVLDAGSSLVTRTFSKIKDPWHVYVGDLASGPTAFTSNPRGIVFDPGPSAAGSDDRIHVVTQFDDLYYSFAADDPPSSPSDGTGVLEATLGSGSVGQSKRNFFTFGKGFDFREPGGVGLINNSAKVNNLACATCHVEGHIDGKVRLTVRRPENQDNDDPDWKPVAVPSLFDVGATEWIFFEGLRTVEDAEESGGDCNYCMAAGFFFDTATFSNSVSSPASPFAPSGDLAADAERGRSYFEAMNCVRCHAGPTPGFCRTDEPELPQGVPATGPLNQQGGNFLNDPTQVFISFTIVGNTTEPPDTLSLRNITDVGTRVAGDALLLGVNTPALAGAWDNGPFLHDGRYRSLEEVLDHTWVHTDTADPATFGRAAPPSAFNVPDNAYDHYPPAGTGCNTDIPGPLRSARRLDPLFTFGTHSPGSPGSNRTKVGPFLDGIDAMAEADLLAFLRSLSSETDLCGQTALTLSAIAVKPCDGPLGTTKLSWTTSQESACRLVWGEAGSADQVVITPAATSHSISVPVTAGTDYEATVTTGSGLCDALIRNATWTAPTSGVTISAIEAQSLPFCETLLTWSTNQAVTCEVRWGRLGTGMPNHASTTMDTDHAITVGIEQNKKYEVEVTVCDGVDTAYRTWKTPKYCATQSAVAARVEVLSAAPNPFRASTNIRFHLEEQGMATIRIYSIAGRLLRTIQDGEMPAGDHEVSWTGKTDSGRRVGSGIYYVVLSTPKQNTTRKIVVL